MVVLTFVYIVLLNKENLENVFFINPSPASQQRQTRFTAPLHIFWRPTWGCKCKCKKIGGCKCKKRRGCNMPV